MEYGDELQRITHRKPDIVIIDNQSRKCIILEVTVCYANNYRPISIISVFARIFEKIVHDQLYNFLSINNILTPSQSAFRKLHSTITSLINCTDNWYINIDKKQLNLSLSLDLKKAFDTVDHKIMVKKLNAIGVRGIAGLSPTCSGLGHL